MNLFKKFSKQYVADIFYIYYDNNTAVRKNNQLTGYPF